MPLERAELLIKEGLEEEFAAAMRDKGIGILKAFPGVVSARYGRGVENPGKFILLVEWTSMEAHAAYNKAPECMEIRRLIGGFSKGGAMEHFELA
jgi:heme-degrading monooxygenase HmoA